MRVSLRPFATLLLTLFLAAGPCAALPVEAQTTAAAGAAIGGNVVDQQTGLAVSGATVTLYQGATRVASTVSDSNGRFAFPSEPAGLYDIDIAAVGYQTSRLTDEAVSAGAGTINVRIAVPRAMSSESSLRQIGRVTATSNRNALATTTVVNRTINADLIQREANLRLGDALLAAPGLTSFNLDSAPGDDLNISIRGLRPSEAQTLVDGHPVGPIGVFNGTGGGFNYQLSPTYALSNVQITYGTGGIVAARRRRDRRDDRLPNAAAHEAAARSSCARGFGTQSRMQTVLNATGTAGRLGYAVSYGVDGTTGNASPQTFTQTGLLNGDLTTAQRRQQHLVRLRQLRAAQRSRSSCGTRSARPRR